MNIIPFLKENKDARKIFGKRELKIIEKQLWGINLTQSEKNRLSRDIRKKFECIRQISMLNIDFGLKKGSEIKKYINQAVEEIKSSGLFNKIREIILFGSSVKNKRNFKSDIDICIKFQKKLTAKEFIELKINLMRNLPDIIDLQNYDILPEKIKKEIDKNGKTLWKKHG